MDRKIRDQRDRTGKIDKTRDDRASLAQRDASCRGKRPVEPGRAKHPAVFFHVQPDIAVGGFDRRGFLDLEGGRVAVRRGEHQPRGRSFGDLQRDQRRAVAPHKDLVPTLNGEIPRFIQFTKTRRHKRVLYVFHGVESAGGAGDIVKKLRIEIH